MKIYDILKEFKISNDGGNLPPRRRRPKRRGDDESNPWIKFGNNFLSQINHQLPELGAKWDYIGLLFSKDNEQQPGIHVDYENIENGRSWIPRGHPEYYIDGPDDPWYSSIVFTMEARNFDLYNDSFVISVTLDVSPLKIRDARGVPTDWKSEEFERAVVPGYEQAVINELITKLQHGYQLCK